MSTRQRFTERTSARIVGTILDRDGNVVPADSLTDATLKLWDLDTGAVINGRDNQDILGSTGSPLEENGVTFYNELQPEPDGTTYNFEWLLEAADNAMPDESLLTVRQIADLKRRQIWRHKALFRFLVGAIELNSEFEIDVDNLRMAPQGSPS